jgi:hypothetical protein
MWWEAAANMTANWESLARYGHESDALKTYSLMSHIAFVGTIAVSLRYRYFLPASLEAVALLLSVAYHSCVIWDVCGGYAVGDLQVADHITATLLFVAATFMVTSPQDENQALHNDRAEDYNPGSGAHGHLTAPPPAAYHLRYSHVALPLQLVACALIIGSDPYSPSAIYTCIAVSLLCVLGYFVIFRVERRTYPGAPDFGQVELSVPYLVLTLATAGLAVLCFLADEPSSILHSTWHVWASATLAFLVLTFETRPCGPPPRRLPRH